MKRLSSGMTVFHRTFVPTVIGIFCCVFAVGTGGHLGFLWIGLPCMLASAIWFGRRLSDVWLDGDVLQIRGPAGSLRVPLGEVMLFHDQFGRERMIVLRLDHPVGKVKEVRFIPEGSWVAFGPNPADALEKDLEQRIHAARAARTG